MKVIIEAGSKTVGGFRCSTCPEPSSLSLPFNNGHGTGSLTAGEVWKFFDDQGVDSLRQLTLSLEFDSTVGMANAGISSLELTIENPSNLESLTRSLGNNSLSIQGYDIKAHKPEANLEFALGYNFMQRFSADSTEIILLNLSGDANSQPVVSVQGVEENGFFSSVLNLRLLAFAFFWALVFVALHRFTKPQANVAPAKVPERTALSPPKHRALSA